MKQLVSQLLVLLGFIAVPLFVKGQTQLNTQGPKPSFCGTPAPSNQYVKQLRTTYEQYVRQLKSSRQATSMNYLPVRFIIVRKSDGSEGPSYDAVNRGLAQLNNYFLPADIQFYTAPGGMAEAKSDRLYDINTSTMLADMQALMVTDAINIFIVNTGKDNSQSFAGQASLPTTDNNSNWLVIQSVFLTNGTVFHHEMGHYLALFHPHDNTTGTRELVNGSNCAVASDFVCDTPADPYDLVRDPKAPLQTICTYNFDVKDANGQLYNPLLNNIMGYWNCQPLVFTKGQYDRIRTVGMAARTNPANKYKLNAPVSTVTAPVLAAGEAGTGPVRLTWQDKSDNETGFIIERSTSESEGFIAVDGVGPNTTQWVDARSESGKTYYYRIRPANSFTYSNSVFGKQGYCVPVQRDIWSCASTTGTIGIQALKIWSAGKTATLLDSKNSCSLNGNAYSDLTNQPAIKLRQGAAFPFQLEAMRVQEGAYKGNIYPVRVSIWLDLNQDFAFTENERLFVSNPSVAFPNPFMDDQFAVPRSALTGLTRMRIRAGTAFSTTPESACEQIDGETEDYLVNVESSCQMSVTLAASSTVICQGSSTTLTAAQTGGQGVVRYQWQRDNVNLIETTNSIVANSAGVYRLIAVDANDCTRNVSTAVAVNPQPVPIITGAATICAGQSATLLANNSIGTGPFVFTWQHDQRAAGLGNTLVALSSGTYSVSVTDSKGCSGLSAGFLLIEKATPNTQITSGSTGLNLLAGGTVVLTTNAGVGTNYQWYLNNNSLAGATSASFVATQAGIYTVSVTRDGCTGTSPAASVLLVTAIEPVLSAELSVWPNPTAGRIEVRLTLPKTGSVSLLLYDATGRRIHSWPVLKGKISYKVDADLNGLPAGLYLLTANIDGYQLVRKLLLE